MSLNMPTLLNTPLRSVLAQQQGERKGWDAVWVTGEELCHEGILLSPRMMEDHYALTMQASWLDSSMHTAVETSVTWNHARWLHVPCLQTAQL